MAKRGFNGVLMRTFGAQDHIATVIDKEYLTPKYLRIRLVSPTLFDEAESGPAVYLRFWFPDPDGSGVEHQRGYTIVEANEDTGEFTIDVVLHEPSGPASIWAVAAKPGMRVAVMALGSVKFEVPEELPAAYLLIGDSASIPAINGILETIPKHLQVDLYLEEHDPDDQLIPLTSHPRLTTHWVPYRGPETLAAAIEPRDWSNWYAWVAPESGTLKHLRPRLRDEFGFPKSELHLHAYWVRGRAMGKNRSQDEASTTSHPTPEATTPAEPVQIPQQNDEMTGKQAATSQWRSQSGRRLLKPLKSTFIIAGVVQALVTLMQLAPFFLLVELSRMLLTGAARQALISVGIWAVVLIGAGVLFSSALLLWLHWIDARFERELRGRMLRKLSRLPLGWFDSRTSGQVKQLVQDDTFALHYLVTHAVPDAVAAVVAPLGVLGYLFVVDWRMALLLFVPVLVYIITMYIMLVQSGVKTAQSLRWADRMNSEAGSYLEGQPVVRVFGGATASTFHNRLSEYIAFLNDWQRPFNGQKSLMDLATRPATFLLVITSFGTLFVTTGSMDPVALLPFLFLGTTFGGRLLGIGYGLSGLRTGLLAAKRVQLVLDERELEVENPVQADVNNDPMTSPATASGKVTFDKVNFSYVPGVPTLEDISLTLQPGTVTALVGSSGSGKSTLAALLARFHDVDAGSIRIDGQDIRGLTPDELYARVGFVFQQTQLVQGTVRDNIALAQPEATDEQVEQAARSAQLHDRILRMPNGYDTLLGPDAALSGGERQRLTIARAILADTPILVLDEATAFADPESEYLVQQALNQLTQNRTVLVIAHRLHTITAVDRIVVVDHGRVVETGTHKHLLACGGRYRQLWDAAGSHASHHGAHTPVSHAASIEDTQ